jgi:hypothetical protein
LNRSPRLAGALKGATSGATYLGNFSPDNQAVKRQVCQVLPLVDVESFYACPLGMRHDFN